MAHTDPRTEMATKASAAKFPPTDVVEMGKQRLDATIAAQTELLDKFKEINNAWLARAQSEADLAAELTTKLVAARSLPDATAAWQEWANKRMSLLAEDGKRLVADGQKIAETGVRLCANGWTPGGST